MLNRLITLTLTFPYNQSDFSIYDTPQAWNHKSSLVLVKEGFSFFGDASEILLQPPSVWVGGSVRAFDWQPMLAGAHRQHVNELALLTVAAFRQQRRNGNSKTFWEMRWFIFLAESYMRTSIPLSCVYDKHGLKLWFDGELMKLLLVWKSVCPAEK